MTSTPAPAVRYRPYSTLEALEDIRTLTDLLIPTVRAALG